MDGLSRELMTKLRQHGTKAVIEHLEKVLNTNDNAQYPKIKTQVVDFIISQQDELDDCAVKIRKCLQENGISVDDVDQIFKPDPRRPRRRDRALETIEKYWGTERIGKYHWDGKGVHFLEKLAAIARKKKEWRAAVGLFNRVISDSRKYGDWGNEDHHPERPIEQAHVTKVLRYLKRLEGEGAVEEASTMPDVQRRPSIVPLGREELEFKGYEVDVNDLLIARSVKMDALSNDIDSPERPSILDPEKTTSQAGDSDFTSADSHINTDDCFDNVLNTTRAEFSASGPSDRCTDGGVNLSESGGPGGGDTASERAATAKPNPQGTYLWDQSGDKRPLEVLLREGFEQLQERIHESAAKVIRSQQDSMVSITEAMHNLDARARSTAEATRLFMDHNTKLMRALDKQLIGNSCRCENVPIPHGQEHPDTGLYEDLSRQLTQLREDLEFTRSSITQEISHHVLHLDKELAGQVKAQTQNDLDILYKATKDHLEQLHQASRDCIAHAGIAIAGELQPIASAGSAITDRISNTVKKHMEETIQCHRQEFEKSTTQIKHEFSEKSCGIQNQQTVILTAIESQTKTTGSAMSIVQDTVASMIGEIRELREGLVALGHSCANFGAVYTQNTTLEHGKDFEIAKRYQDNGNIAGTFRNIDADFTVSSSAHDAHMQDRSETYGGIPVSSRSHSLNCDHPFVTLKPSPEIKTDAGVLYITDGSDTADFEHEILEKKLVGQEMRADDDMTDVLNVSTFFTDPVSMIPVFATCDTRRSRRIGYPKERRIIAFPFNRLISDTVSDRRVLAAHPRIRSSRREKRTSIMGSKVGHRGGDRTAGSMKEAVRIKKWLDKKREARLRSREWRSTRPSDHVEAQILEERNHGGVRLEQPTTDSDKKDAWSVEKSDSLIRDLGTNLGCYNSFGSHMSDPSSVQRPHGDHTCADVPSAAARFEDDNEILGNLEVGEDIASAAVTQIRESQENSRNQTWSDALEASDKPLMSASAVMTVNAAEASPTQDTSASLATEEIGSQATHSRYNNNISSESLPNDHQHKMSSKDEAMIALLENCKTDSLGKSDAMYVSPVQSQGQPRSSEDTDDVDHPASYDKGCPIAAESETSGNNDGKTSQPLRDPRVERQVYGDLVALGERLGARTKHHFSGEHMNAVPDEVKEENVHGTLRGLEAIEMDKEQPVHEVTEPDYVDDSETLISGDYHSHQMTSRSDELSHRSDVADLRNVHSFGGVTNEAEESWQSEHLTSDWTMDPDSELRIPSVTKPPKLNEFQQQVIEDEHYDSPDAGSREDEPVVAPPLVSLVSDRDIATAETDSILSSTVDKRNASEVSDHIQEYIGTVRESITDLKDGPQLRTSDPTPLDNTLLASTPRPIKALLSRKSCKSDQQSPQEGIDHNVSPSKHRDGDESAAASHPLEAIRSNHSASSTPEESRGQKRLGVMPDRDDKDKRPRLLSNVETEIKTTYVSKSGRNQNAVAVPKPSTCIPRKRIPTSLQGKETFASADLFATVQQGTNPIEGIDPKSRQNRDEPIELTASRDERNLVEGKPMVSTSGADPGPSPTTTVAQTDIVSNNHAPAIEDMTSLGVKRSEGFSLRQPASASPQESRGKKRSREESDELSERENKVVRLTSRFGEDVDGAGMRPHMATSDDNLREQIMGSSGVGVPGSPTLLDQNPESESDHQYDMENDPPSSTQLDVMTLGHVESGSKTLFERWKRKRKGTKRTTRSAKRIVQRSREKRKYRIAAGSLKNPFLVSLDENSQGPPPGVTLGITPLSAAEEQGVEHVQFGTHVDVSTDSKGQDEQRLPRSLPQEMITDEDGTGVNIHENSSDRQDFEKSHAQSGATTDRSADSMEHMNSQSRSTQASSDGHGRLQSLDPFDKEVIDPTQSSQASGYPSHSSTVTRSATGTVGSVTCEETVQPGLNYDDDDVVGHAVKADYFSQTVAELE